MRRIQSPKINKLTSLNNIKTITTYRFSSSKSKRCHIRNIIHRVIRIKSHLTPCIKEHIINTYHRKTTSCLKIWQRKTSHMEIKMLALDGKLNYTWRWGLRSFRISSWRLENKQKQHVEKSLEIRNRSKVWLPAHSLYVPSAYWICMINYIIISH